MAIYSSVPPPEQQGATALSTSGINIEAWTVSALQSLNISESARGTGVALSIPLDTHKDVEDAPRHVRPRPKPPSRDSQKRREALQKGKEGSRRRQRWENGM
jgi:hypothetical protein